MKTHSTNYTNTFIKISDDCPATCGEAPPKKETKSIADIQFEIVYKNPYKYTSDDVFFMAFAERNDLTESEYKEAREQFFSKGQPCFRASPLTKRYGWGVHANKDAKVAIYGCDTSEYKTLSEDKNLKIVKAMKSSKK